MGWDDEDEEAYISSDASGLFHGKIIKVDAIEECPIFRVIEEISLVKQGTKFWGVFAKRGQFICLINKGKHSEGGSESYLVANSVGEIEQMYINRGEKNIFTNPEKSLQNRFIVV